MHSGESRHPRLPFSLSEGSEEPILLIRISLSLSHPPRCPLFYSWLVGLRPMDTDCRPTYLDDVSILKRTYIQRSFLQIIHRLWFFVRSWLPPLWIIFLVKILTVMYMECHIRIKWKFRFVKLFLISCKKTNREVQEVLFISVFSFFYFLHKCNKTLWL